MIRNYTDATNSIARLEIIIVSEGAAGYTNMVKKLVGWSKGTMEW